MIDSQSTTQERTEQDLILDKMKQFIHGDKENDPLLGLPDDEVSEIISRGGSIIKKRHFEIIERECKKEGLVTLRHDNTGTTMPWRPKMTLFLIRMAEGEETKSSKWLRIPSKPGSKKKKRSLVLGGKPTQTRPFVYQEKLFSVYPLNASMSKSEQLKEMMLRFSTAKNILQQLVEGFQQHKQISDDEFDSIISVPKTEGDTDSQEETPVPAGTGQALEVREIKKDVLDEATEQRHGNEE